MTANAQPSYGSVWRNRSPYERPRKVRVEVATDRHVVVVNVDTDRQSTIKRANFHDLYEPVPPPEARTGNRCHLRPLPELRGQSPAA